MHPQAGGALQKMIAGPRRYTGNVVALNTIYRIPHASCEKLINHEY